MTERTCPNGGTCPSQRCRNYVPGRRCVHDVAAQGEHTLQDIAAQLGVSERQVRKDAERAVAKLRALPADALAGIREILDLDPGNLSTEDAGIFGPQVRFLRGLVQSGDHAPRGRNDIDDGAPPFHRATRAPRGASVSRRKVTMSIFGNLICAIADLRARLFVVDADRDRLVQLARAGDAERFRAELLRVESSAPEHDASTELDAFALHSANPYLLSFMRAAQLLPDDVRKHGPRGALTAGTRVLPNLAELAAATEAQRDR